MSVMTPVKQFAGVQYPDDDGLPMADNTEQAKWIVMLYGNICAVLSDVVDVSPAMNHLWYPVVGHAEIRTAPDVMVVFGRPRLKRGSYKQWEEANVPVTVAFEVLSPSNNYFEVADKLAFYDEYGVEEYYIYDPDHNRLEIHLRKGDVLIWHRKVDGFVSPRLGIRFDLSGPEMIVYYPDGRRFRVFEDIERERLEAEQRADSAQNRANVAEERLQRQSELMRRVLAQQATPAELQELQQLLEPSRPVTP